MFSPAARNVHADRAKSEGRSMSRRPWARAIVYPAPAAARAMPVCKSKVTFTEPETARECCWSSE